MSKTVKSLTVLFGLFALTLVSARPCQAILIQTNSTDNPNELAYPASTTDLINAGQPTLGTVTHTDYTNLSTFSIGGLNDGELGTASTQTPEAAFDLDGTWTSEFNLNLLGGPLSQGYTITEISTIVGWAGDRAGQQYSLEYSLIDDPTFASLGSFSLFKTDTGSSRITLTDSSGAIATGVDAIRFSFVDPATGSASVYREIDIQGFEVVSLPVPEPSTAFLFSLGLLGFAKQRRRRKV